MECRSTPVIAYESAGVVAVAGLEAAALSAAASLGDTMDCTVVVTDSTDRSQSTGGGSKGGNLIYAPVAGIRGYLGRFEIVLAGPNGPVGLGEVTTGRRWVDIVLDLTMLGFISGELPPIRYYAPTHDPIELARALAEIPELVGSFEKPKFVNYGPEVCAHGRSVVGPAPVASTPVPPAPSPTPTPGSAIPSKSCGPPCGHIGRPGATGLESCSRMLERGKAVLTRLASRLPGYVIPVESEEIGSVGMDIWLAAIAYGAARVLLLVPPAVAASVVAELKVQLTVAGAILEGMGYPHEILRLVRDPNDEQMITELDATETRFELRSAGFAGLDEKCTVIRLALDHLFQEAPALRPLVSLPVGAPFGDVLLDEKRCTLCMACVSQCPGQGAAGRRRAPRARFVEENGVQCALCARSCPDAIAPTPRYLYDREARRRRRVLKSEEPLCCIRCGKPFATRGTVERVRARLAGHPLFQGEARSHI